MTSLLEIVQAHKLDSQYGIYSICSANPYVLKAAMMQAQQDGSLLLIESTSNQVDQFGGYTGLTPGDFVSYVHRLAAEQNFSLQNLILGGDHLGPNSWQKESSAIAMEHAHELIRSSVAAGYTKIHLDTSMRCADDPGDAGAPLDVNTIARRAAELCKTAEKTAQIHPGNRPLVYVIGSDVPIPGGAQETLEELHITSVSEIEETIDVCRKYFMDFGLEDAWQRVMAVVVQPGVEFDDTKIIDYNPRLATEISRFIEQYSGLIFEAHSTDYQKPDNLKKMVEDHFVVLKVGPWLTFALREALFAFSYIENEWLTGRKGTTLSNLLAVIEQVMINKPKYWERHYRGDTVQLQIARKYSLSDRIRYYWPEPQIQSALKRLLDNLSHQSIPLALISQFLPKQYEAIRSGKIQNDPPSLISDKIREIVKIYARVTKSAKMLQNIAE